MNSACSHWKHAWPPVRIQRWRHPHPPPLTDLDDLSPREIEVLRLLASGKSNQEIAETLFISRNTVSTHVRNILTKTGCANRTEAAAYAMRHGLSGAQHGIFGQHVVAKGLHTNALFRAVGRN